ncbi:hypothetical protein BH10PSE17_BH10PSE17_09060 [soil metagenome]
MVKSGLLLGLSLAAFGAWIDYLAILTMAAFVYRAGPTLMACFSALFLIPSMLLAPAIGRWIDRGGADRILVAALVIRACVTALLMTSPSIALFCVLVAVRSVLSVPADPAGNVLARLLVAPAEVPRYIALLGLLRNVAKVAAPAGGAVLASRFGEDSSLMLSIVLTVAGAVAVLIGLRSAQGALPPLVNPFRRNRPAGPTTATASKGIDRTLRAQLLWTVTIFALVVFVVNNQMPVLLRDAGFDKAWLGVLVSCSGAGGILSALVMTRRNATLGAKDPMSATVVSVLAIAACFVALGFVFRLPVAIASYGACALFFLTGAFAAVEAIRSNTVIVQRFPEAVGAVSAAVVSWQSAAMLLAPWLAAAVLPWLTMSTLFLVDGALGFLSLAAVTLWFRSIGTQGRVAAAIAK